MVAILVIVFIIFVVNVIIVVIIIIIGVHYSSGGASGGILVGVGDLRIIESVIFAFVNLGG